MITARSMPPVTGNRLVKAKRRLDAQNVVATYAYDGLNRRIKKDVTNCGEGIVDGSDAGGAVGLEAGNKSEHYYYAGWRVVEETDNAGTPKTLAQTVYGTEYIDEPICRDRNSDTTYGGSADSDCLDSGGSARYFYHQDANYRVAALTDESAAVVERYEYDAYGEPRVYAGGTGVQTLGAGNLLSVSAVGNPLMHQGLRRDDETGLHENRMRVLHSRLGRFMQRDPAGYVDGFNLYEYLRTYSIGHVDPLGLAIGPDLPPWWRDPPDYGGDDDGVGGDAGEEGAEDGNDEPGDGGFDGGPAAGGHTPGRDHTPKSGPKKKKRTGERLKNKNDQRKAECEAAWKAFEALPEATQKMLEGSDQHPSKICDRPWNLPLPVKNPAPAPAPPPPLSRWEILRLIARYQAWLMAENAKRGITLVGEGVLECERIIENAFQNPVIPPPVFGPVWGPGRSPGWSD